MEEKTFQEIIVELRKEKGLTQQELASKLNITDKAVSKWERGLSYPDITSISQLAKVLGVDSSYLIDSFKSNDNNNPYSNKEDVKQLITFICNTIGVAMGISVVVLNILDKIEVQDSITLLGIGLFCISISVMSKEEKTPTLIKKK